MEKPSLMTVIGLMSGTSLDGVDVAVLKTDGLLQSELLHFSFHPYAADIIRDIKACFGHTDRSLLTDRAEKMVTQAHLAAIKASFIDLTTIDLIGFHGQTITHRPESKFTWQIGDAQVLADKTSISTVYNFRIRDVQEGGQGAPLLPIYHQHLVQRSGVELPIVVINIGGVSNLTYISGHDDDLVAFDTGPGNALLDDWVYLKTGMSFDQDGALSSCGMIDKAILDQWLEHRFFKKSGTKSLDRNEWSYNEILHLGASDGAATLAAFTAHSIAKGVFLLPRLPKCAVVCGGGRKNKSIMRMLESLLECPVLPCDHLGWNGDAIEAEGFAYMAARSIAGLPISFPKTTGVANPLSGGVLVKPRTRL